MPNLLNAALLGRHGAVGAGQGLSWRGRVLLVAAHGRRADGDAGTGSSPSFGLCCGSELGCHSGGSRCEERTSRQELTLPHPLMAARAGGDARPPISGSLTLTAPGTQNLLRETEPWTYPALSRLQCPALARLLGPESAPAPSPHRPAATRQPHSQEPGYRALDQPRSIPSQDTAPPAPDLSHRMLPFDLSNYRRGKLRHGPPLPRA